MVADRYTLYILIKSALRSICHEVEEEGRNTDSKKSRRMPAMTRAVSFLASLGEAAARKTITQMAREANVSYVTMWKAVQGARSTTICESHQQRQPVPRPLPPYHELASRIEQDLLYGRLPQGPALPQIKELRVRYNAGFRTVRKALSELHRKNVVDRVGRNYHATVSVPRAPSFTVAVLMFAWYKGPLRFVVEYDGEFMTSLDLEWSRRKVRTEVMRFSEKDGVPTITDAHCTHEQNLRARRDIDGYVLLVSSMRALCPGLLDQLHETGKPVVLVDQIGGWETPAFLARPDRTLVLKARPHEEAARDIARTLVSLGHRRCAFFSVFHRDLWSQRCLDGLMSVFGTAGEQRRLDPFLMDGTQISGDYVAAGWRRCPDTWLRRGYNHWKEKAPPAYVRQFEPYFEFGLEEQIWNAEVRYQLEQLLDRAAVDTSTTCWIAPDVDTAGFINDYIFDHRLDVSVVAFGWSPEVIKSRIAAYDFNASAAARVSVDFLLYPQARIPGRKGLELDIKGSLAMRESLRRV